MKRERDSRTFWLGFLVGAMVASAMVLVWSEFWGWVL